MRHFYIIVDCTLGTNCYCYGMSISDTTDVKALDRAKAKMDRRMRKWFPKEVEAQEDYKVGAKIHQEHIPRY